MALTVAETLPSMISDARLKQDIRRVGLLDNGLPVYAFRFMGGPTQIGLLAQEVQQALPEAVTKGPKGLLAVNYDMATQAPQQGPPQGAMPPPQGMPPQMPQQPPMSPQMAPQGMPMGGAPNGMG